MNFDVISSSTAGHLLFIFGMQRASVKFGSGACSMIAPSGGSSGPRRLEVTEGDDLRTLTCAYEVRGSTVSNRYPQYRHHGSLFAARCYVSPLASATTLLRLALTSGPTGTIGLDFEPSPCPLAPKSFFGETQSSANRPDGSLLCGHADDTDASGGWGAWYGGGRILRIDMKALRTTILH